MINFFPVKGRSLAKRISFVGGQNNLRNCGHPLQRLLHLRNCFLRKFGKSVIGYRMVQRIRIVDPDNGRRIRKPNLQTRSLSSYHLVRNNARNRGYKSTLAVPGKKSVLSGNTWNYSVTEPCLTKLLSPALNLQ